MERLLARVMQSLDGHLPAAVHARVHGTHGALREPVRHVELVHGDVRPWKMRRRRTI
eukprot:CAMPEP_0174720840 /NCGR_PEP_ID=MMETSP1094-20130205/34656_1 /TAXON_ID=156173 /ORGANISM="Chrysochromulina brevifilum, Strain UTEX LB 985" /LENGTH=56 /DNA_ID=CAMNT_0015921409 /DNA_START=1239 /DNA_END=1409 /DNA_ORIENTATION=-